MSVESELDKVFSSKAELPVQEKFIEQPVFSSLFLIENTLPIFKKGIEIIQRGPRQPGFQTNVTQIEFLYPWILQKIGLIKMPLPEKGPFSPIDAATVLGDKLHRADILFNLIVDRIHPLEVASRLPNHPPQEIARFQAAIEGLELTNKKDKNEIEERLVEAWRKFHNQRGFFGPSDVPLPGFGFISPQVQEEVFYGENVYQLGILLAKAWADHSTRPEPISWEFVTDAFTQREVLTAMNFDLPKIQFIARLDSISRFRKTKGKVDSQIVDLKTGKKVEQGGLAKDVEIRQAQVTRVIAERFTARYLRGKRSLVPRDTAFYCRADHRNRAFLERVDMAGYRRFNKDTGTMEIEPIEMTESDRREFEDWFTWYGAMIHYFRADMEKLRRQKIQYDLTGISFSELNY